MKTIQTIFIWLSMWLLVLPTNSLHLSAQPCSQLPIFLTSQRDVDNFPINYTGCNTIELGTYLQISGADITNLDSLIQLEQIGGELIIQNNPILTDLSGLSRVNVANEIHIINNASLVNLNGLSGLQRAGEFSIEQNGALATLMGLSGLQSIMFLTLTNNPSLISLQGLSSLTQISYDLRIDNNDNLLNLNGAETLEEIGRDFYVTENDALIHFDGLFSLQTIGNQFIVNANNSLQNFFGMQMFSGSKVISIENNPILTSFTGMYSLNHISDLFRITDNNSIQSMVGLESLKSCSGRIEITQNNALTDFTGLTNLTEISGDFSIFKNPSLQNFNGLSNLNKVTGHLYVQDNDQLIDFTGLGSLKEIGIFSVVENSTLEDLEGLEMLESIKQGFTIRGNEALINFRGLGRLNSIGGVWYIWSNQALISLEGASNLESIGGTTFWIQRNNSLRSLEGIRQLKHINGSLWISNNDSLAVLSGLNGLMTLGGGISFSSNRSLVNMDGLGNLRTINGAISLLSNESLESLAGLVQLESASISTIQLLNNPLLSFCEVKPICEYLIDSLRPRFINNNAPGCNDAEEILEACENPCELIASFTANPEPICPGDTCTLTAVAEGGIEPFIYIWEHNPVGGPVQIVTPEEPTFFEVTIIDGRGCESTRRKQVDVLPFLEYDILSSPAICGLDNGVAGIQPGPDEVFSYLWDTGDTLQMIRNLAEGIYYLTITSEFGCQAVDSVLVERLNPETIPVEIVGDTQICKGSQGQLMTSIEYDTYRWPDGSTDSVFIFEEAGTIRVEVTLGTCRGVDSIETTVWDVPIIVIMQRDTLLEITLSGGLAPYYITWNTGDTSAIIFPQLAGAYAATVTDSHGCTATGEIEFTGTAIKHPISFAPMVYPNPTTDQLYIHLQRQTAVAKIKLISAAGQTYTFHVKETSDPLQLPVGHLTPGLHILHVQTGEDNWLIKFVKL